jgi:hypothetical protein
MVVTKNSITEKTEPVTKPERGQVSNEVRDFIMVLLPSKYAAHKTDMWLLWVSGKQAFVRVNVWEKTEKEDCVCQSSIICHSEFMVIERCPDGLKLVKRNFQENVLTLEKSIV